jgi:hypothetical protein
MGVRDSGGGIVGPVWLGDKQARMTNRSGDRVAEHDCVHFGSR